MSYPRIPGRGQPAGFCLADLLITLLIVGILAMVAVPAMSSALNEARLSAAARQMADSLEYARGLASQYGRAFYVGIKESDNSFQVGDLRFKDETVNHLDDAPPVSSQGIVYHPISRARYAVDFDERAEYQGVDIIDAPTDMFIVFYPDGHVAETDPTVTLALGDLQRSITVDAMTGKVNVN
ncbi:MAG: hypothetical protein JEZ11_01590 [Desulfobacterales bacterium]|nr:hypothetical protein [Desulfobacterales bacterium]